jgi:hypothetical protein
MQSGLHLDEPYHFHDLSITFWPKLSEMQRSGLHLTIAQWGLAKPCNRLFSRLSKVRQKYRRRLPRRLHCVVFRFGIADGF